MTRWQDRAYWHHQRRRAVREGAPLLDTSAHHLPSRQIPDDAQRHLVVIPSHGPDVANWHTAGGNHFYEIHRSAAEVLGPDQVSLFAVAPDEPWQDWQPRLLQHMSEVGATHIIGQIETDPNQPESWNWDIFGSALDGRWSGAFIGFMHDIAYEWLEIRARFLGRINDSLLITEICEPVDGVVRRGRPEVGPSTLPMSQESVAAIDARVSGLTKQYDVSFIGALYGYRVELLDRLSQSGIEVAVNPHRTDVTRNEHDSKHNQPSYLDYLAGIAQSRMTINFSLANGGPHEQYKIRVQEAALVGTVCLTDDRDRSRHFFAEGQVSCFSDIDSLVSLVSTRLEDPDRLAVDSEAARHRAHELSRTDFWGRVESGLQQRGLPWLTRLEPPREPDGSRP